MYFKMRYQEAYWFRLICCSRLSLAFLQMTADVPDEFYQGPEVAYNLVYERNDFTWEWKHQLRSFLHPLFYALPFQLLKFYNLDFSILLVLVPRLQHAVLSIIGETLFCSMINKLHGVAVASWTAFCLSTCIFANHCFSRTLSNSLETSLMMMAFAYYPGWSESLSKAHDRKFNFFKFLVFSALACFARPTSAVLSVPMSFYCLYLLDSKTLMIFQMWAIGMNALIAQTLIDSLLYGRLCFPLWNFVKFNFLSNNNQIFGVNSPLWFVYCGLPGVLGTFLPFFVAGAWKSWKDRRMSRLMIVLIVYTVAVYSIPPHKEMRFILPVLPLMLVYSAYYFANCASVKTQNICRWSLACVNTVVTLYLTIFHQSGSVFAAHYLNVRLRNMSSPSVLALTPCFTLPGRTHMHIEHLVIRDISCHPNLQQKENYLTETQQFIESPRLWVVDNLSSDKPFQNFSFVVMFNSVHPELDDLLERDGFQLDKSFHFSHFPDRAAGQSENILLFSKNKL